MTKGDVIAGISAKPVPFTVAQGATVNLRPLRFGERLELGQWYVANKDTAGSAAELQRRLVVLSVSDENGESLLTASDVDRLDALAVDAIAQEVSRRNGLDGDEGKSAEPTPQS